MKTQRLFLGLVLSIVAGIACQPLAAGGGEFRVGAAVVDVTPQKFPVLVNGGMLSRSASEVNTRLHARAIALEDGEQRVAIVVVDSCMMPRELLDEAKQLAAERSGIRPENVMISATHSHTAPSSFGCLGTDADAEYSAFLRLQLAEAIVRAAERLEPAQVGMTVVNAEPFTAIRRWVRRPDRMRVDPFGNLTVRANMHPGHLSDDATGESGPIDPDLSIISFQTRDGHPLALFANFSMHYFGDKALSADYFGLFADRLQKQLAQEGPTAETFVVAMSHGCSGDIWLRDYSKPAPATRPDISSYTDGLVALTAQAYPRIKHRADVTLAMAQAELPLKYRTPDLQRLEWARRITKEMGDRPPADQKEVYAREAILLHEKQATEVILQAIRIGEIGITSMPNEVYALTGLKLKALSPLKNNVVLDLANGAEGYIPPPEQHVLGGYNTWPARSAGLEEQAEPKMVETLLQLLEKVSGRERRSYQPARGPAAKALLAHEPLAYWRLDEMSGPRAEEVIAGRDGIYEDGVVFFLKGPHSAQFQQEREVNRAAHFAGGRMRARLPQLADKYSVSLWFYNGMPNDAREITGWMFSRGRDHGLAAGESLGIGGTAGHAGKLIFSNGRQTVGGKQEIERWTWNHVLLVRDGERVAAYLNGEPDFSSSLPAGKPQQQMFVGGHHNNLNNFEGRLDEAAIFAKALSAGDARQIYQAATK